MPLFVSCKHKPMYFGLFTVFYGKCDELFMNNCKMTQFYLPIVNYVGEGLSEKNYEAFILSVTIILQYPVSRSNNLTT